MTFRISPLGNFNPALAPLICRRIPHRSQSAEEEGASYVRCLPAQSPTKKKRSLTSVRQFLARSSQKDLFRFGGEAKTDQNSGARPTEQEDQKNLFDHLLSSSGRVARKGGEAGNGQMKKFDLFPPPPSCSIMLRPPSP